MTKDRFLFWADADLLAGLIADVSVKPRGVAAPPAPSSATQPFEPQLRPSEPEPQPELTPSEPEMTRAAQPPAARNERDIAFQVPPGNIEDRLQALLDWLANEMGCEKVCVLDEEGLALIGSGFEPEWIAAMAEIGRRWMQVQKHLNLPDAGSLTVRSEERLHMIVQPSYFGQLTLVFTVRDSGEIPFSTIRHAFVSLIKEEEGAESYDT